MERGNLSAAHVDDAAVAVALAQRIGASGYSSMVEH
jgi:hypothetical protein